MILYRVTHVYRLDGRPERKEIGIYRSKELAGAAVDRLRTKQGFSDTPSGFRIRRVFRLFPPKLTDRTFWVDGFVTYR